MRITEKLINGQLFPVLDDGCICSDRDEDMIKRLFNGRKITHQNCPRVYLDDGTTLEFRAKPCKRCHKTHPYKFWMEPWNKEIRGMSVSKWSGDGELTRLLRLATIDKRFVVYEESGEAHELITFRQDIEMQQNDEPGTTTIRHGCGFNVYLVNE